MNRILLKWLILPNAMYRFNIIAIRMSMIFFIEMGGIIEKNHMELRRHQIIKIIPHKKKKENCMTLAQIQTQTKERLRNNLTVTAI